MTTPQTPHPYPHPSQPATKSWFARHKLLTVLGAFLVLIVVIVAVNGGGKTDSDTSTAGGDQPAETKSEVGQPVRDGKFEFVVHSVEPGRTEVGGEYLREQAQGQFVLVKLTVRNIGDREQGFSPSAQKLLADGKEYSVDDTATVYLDEGVLYEQINPGNAIDVTIVFDVPVGVVATEIELHDSVLSGGRTVVLD